MTDSKEAVKRGANRDSIHKLLESVTVKDLLQPSPENVRPREVTTLRADDSLEDAMAALAKRSIQAAPVRHEQKEEYIGFVDVMDIVFFVLRSIEEEKDEHKDVVRTAQELTTYGQQLLGKTKVRQVIDASHIDPFIPVKPTATLASVVKDVFAKRVHRAPIIDEQGRLVGLLSQSDVCKLLADRINDIGDIAQCALDDVGLGIIKQEVVSIHKEEKAMQGFLLMMKKKVGAVAVVDKDDRLLANLSASDLRGVPHSGLGSLLHPVLVFISEQPRAGPQRFPMTCKRKTRLQTILLRLGLFRLHRLWLVDDAEKPIGVVTLTDVMRAMAAPE